MCSWAIGIAMVVGLLSAVGVAVGGAYLEYRRLVWTSALLLVLSAIVTTFCSWGTYTM
jgi:hypothetical protein